MPKYRFKCAVGHEREKYTDVNKTEITCVECNEANGAHNYVMFRQLPTSGSQAVSEILDDFTGVKRDQNHDVSAKERREQHYWEVEVPRFIETYSTQTCLEEGWLTYNEKGELVINKPPSKR
jgi:hypothetical protein